MKDFWTFLAICLVFLGVGWYLGFTKSKETIEPQIIHHETTVYDTITDVQENTVQVTHFDTVFLPVFLSDTLIDTYRPKSPFRNMFLTRQGCELQSQENGTFGSNKKLRMEGVGYGRMD